MTGVPVAKIVVLNSNAHLRLRVNAGVSLELGDNQRFVPVVISEFPALVLHYPILFSKDADTGQFYCGVMLGFDPGENLFLDAQRDDGLYRPLNFRREAFYTADDNLAVDLDHPRVGATGDQPLFDEAGQPSPYLQSVMAVLRELKPGLAQTQVFARTLLDLKLIEQVTIKAHFDDCSRREVNGLYTVSHDALADLEGGAVVDLFRRGYLQLIHLQRASLGHVATLAQRRNKALLVQGMNQGARRPANA